MDHLKISRILLGRGVGVGLRNSRPAQGGKFGGGVELHGAGTEGNHGLSGSEVFRGKPTDVAEKFVFVCVRGEDRMKESRGFAVQGGG